MIKKGDTLIEVTLAVGIFSMVAITIVSVMASGTTGAQTALETTLAREEIDAQAEAIRFIQSAYIADKGSEDNRFQTLWQSIVKNAVNVNSTDDELLRYSPQSCNALYADGGEVKKYNAFVINNNQLGTFTKDTVNRAFISVLDKPNSFVQATTYPRLVYNNSDSALDSETSSDNIFYQAEGLYVVAVKESSKEDGYNPTTVVDNGGIVNRPVFYDFYIRSCWYGANANEPSTISTVIRLYDPDAVITSN